jgi:hypothetical protein
MKGNNMANEVSKQTSIPKDSGESRYTPQIMPKRDGSVGANPEGLRRVIENGKAYGKIKR